MHSGVPQEQFFEKLSQEVEPSGAVRASAPARLKSKIYSALVCRQIASGPLLSLTQTYAAGRGLCVFEQLVRIAPVRERWKSLNLCHVCHARALAERIERAPIFWPNCPYVDFHRG